jgi:hypothetical protein
MSLVLFGCRPPVDLDRVPILPASGPPEPEDVMPGSLLGASLSDLWDSPGRGYTGVTGIYADVVVSIYRAEDAAYTSDVMEDELDALKFDARSYSSTQTPWWFQFSGDIGGAFWWAKATWIYGVFAANDDTVIQGAEALIDHLVSLEY